MRLLPDANYGLAVGLQMVGPSDCAGGTRSYMWTARRSGVRASGEYSAVSKVERRRLKNRDVLLRFLPIPV